MEILFYLQDELNTISKGLFAGNRYIKPSGGLLHIVEIDGTKTILLHGRKNTLDGLVIQPALLSSLKAGDRLTITGRLNISETTDGWCLVLRRYEEDGFANLAQYNNPKEDSLFVLTCILDDQDLHNPLHIHSVSWSDWIKPIDFFIDNIIVSRQQTVSGSRDTRQKLYSLEDDMYIGELPSGGYTRYLLASGDPVFSIVDFGGKKNIRVGFRKNDWDGLDIRLSLMNLLPGNRYKITARGYIDGTAPPDAQLTLQLLPTCEWRGNKIVKSNQDFILTYILSEAEIKSVSGIRIASNAQAAEMTFVLNRLDVVVDN